MKTDNDLLWKSYADELYISNSVSKFCQIGSHVYEKYGDTILSHLSFNQIQHMVVEYLSNKYNN